MPRSRLAAALLAFVAAACGGAADDAAPSTTAPAPTEPTTPAATSPATSAPVEPTGTAPSEEPGTYEPGPVSYRLVNLIDQPVDVYVRTQGLVRAFEVELGVQPGTVTEPVAPPADGTFLVITAGAGDPECVATCEHILVALTAFGDDGPIHTVVLHDADGAVGALDLWEQPGDDQVSANAMAPADPSSVVAVVTAIDVADADFGMRLGVSGTVGCAMPSNSDNVLVGGNQTPAFPLPAGQTDLVFFDNQDQECSADPLGGPFTVGGEAGSRTHVILTGSPGSLDAIVVPFVGDSGNESP